jgi:MYXO-CTERM domain-containing protein
MRRLLASWVVGSAVVAAVALAHSPASASAPCDQATLLCSSGLAPQKLESFDRLPINIDTGWIPKCDVPDAQGHCSDKKIQVRAQVALDPMPGGSPALYIVDMLKGANLKAEWPTSDEFVISAVKSTGKEGKFRVTHTLTPEIGLYIDVGFYKGEINIDASTLINLLPGAQFDYVATNNVSFDPWAFQFVSVQVTGSDLAQSKLFAVTFEQLGKLVGTGNFNDYVEGSFSFNATTDTTFEYQTTKVKPIGGVTPISSETGTASFPMQDGDYLEFSEQTEGTLRYSGTLELLPVINITKVGPVGVNLSFPISVGFDFPYDSGALPVTFPAALVHLPLPNVFVPGYFLDFGQVATGGSKEMAMAIENTGELGAMLEFSSSDSQFSPTTVSTQMGPGPDAIYDLKIRFKPTKSGKQQATITVKSNDPDSPVQSFQVMGFGEGPDIPDPGTGGGSGSGGSSAGGDDSGDAGGCGCRMPGGSAPARPLAALGALMALAWLRRRQR